MTVPAGLIGDLSWGLKAAWIAWGIWIAVQVAWRRWAREAGSGDVALRDRTSDRSPLSIAPRPDPIRATAKSPSTPVQIPEGSMASDAVDPADEAPAPRPKRRRRTPQLETAGVLSPEAAS